MLEALVLGYDIADLEGAKGSQFEILHLVKERLVGIVKRYEMVFDFSPLLFLGLHVGLPPAQILLQLADPTF